jgi:two-component system cell cycle sensor histidine kinase/response regulator CckA
VTNMAKRYLRWVRILIVLLTSGGFLLLSSYGKAWTEHNIFPMLFPAVVLSAWLGGRFGGLIATFALAIGTAYYHLPPAGIGVEDAADVIRLGTFTLSGAFVAWLSGALRESQGILMATLQSIGDGVIATDRRGRIRFLNPVAEMLTGWRQSEAKGRPLAEVFRTIDDETRQTVNVPAPLALREAVLLENACLISKNGQQVAVDDSLAPVHVESGRLFGTILVFRDATKRKQAEAALLDSQRRQLQAQRMEALGRLAGGVAHDFNNLLTVIAGYADLALKQIGEDNPARKGIEEIRKAGDRASSLTRQLLIFGRGQPTRLEVVDLSRIVINFEQMLRRLIVEDIELVANLVKDPVPVKVDVGQIEQVIMNLVVNARDAMPQSGRITIETGVKQLPEDDPIAQAGGLGTFYAFLSVADTGVGIDDQVRARLFEPFFTTKEAGRGTGLGLSVIYGIVRSHHGHLRLHSETGRGSVFEVYLPLTEELPEPAQEPPPAQDAPRTKATILLVEDSPEVRMLMRDILANLGYLVLEAGNGQEAIRVAEDHPERIDLLVTDIVMPELGGIELAERLLQNRPQLRVLYVSGYADQETASRALGALSVAYLQKPFSLTELARKVESMISAGGN